MKCLVCGLPGTGKTTYVKEHIGVNGLCYDLDAIAAALRLKSPHEESHAAARGLANSMLFAFCSYAWDYSRDVFIIRTAPPIEELRRIGPDKVVFCKKQYVQRGISGIEKREIVSRIEAVEEYCKRNNIPTQINDGKSRDYIMPVWARKVTENDCLDDPEEESAR